LGLAGEKRSKAILTVLGEEGLENHGMRLKFGKHSVTPVLHSGIFVIIETYLKLTRLKLGYIFNFNTPLLKNGIVRCVNVLDD